MAKDKTETQIDPTLLTKEEAQKLITGLDALLESIKGKTGQAAVIRLKLQAAKDIAGNIQ